MDVYDIGVTILYDGETTTVNERLGSFEWGLLLPVTPDSCGKAGDPHNLEWSCGYRQL